jgi:hypothetical protein
MSRLSADFVIVPLMALFVLKGAAFGQMDRPISGDYSGTAGPARWILHLHAGASTENLCNIDSARSKDVWGSVCEACAMPTACCGPLELSAAFTDMV